MTIEASPDLLVTLACAHNFLEKHCNDDVLLAEMEAAIAGARSSMEMGAAIALDAAVQTLRLMADQAEACGNRDTSSFIHAAASVVRGLTPEYVVAKAMSARQSQDRNGLGPKDASAVVADDLPNPQDLSTPLPSGSIER